MHIHAVFMPRGLSPLRAADEAILVRQGFDWKAFLLTPVWALRHGLWLALALWLGWTFVVAAIVSLAHLDPAASLALYGLGALAFGLEADRFRQARLSRSGFFLQGLTIGESAQEAERLYFDRSADLSASPAQQAALLPASNAPGGGKSHLTTLGADLLGLFPPPERKI
ncbi:DUF2628 domain-containing protein [uncultured Rhodoblastus sp.]|uniref:DUF2628 domain-containing protein n=1 Tax=uncultured Rhodoblastus sp. TaxID=543037 RepID=UPI0025E17C08|nr:DUF2628 domain-containing protein [uncultured Rhodoblastus sp.]